MTTVTDEINRNNMEAKQDNFYVAFFGLPENIGNLLGRQVKEISRPELTFNTVNTRHRGATYVDGANLTYSPMSVTFADDENSLTVMYLYAQLMRQRKAYEYELDDMFGSEYMDMRFGIKVQMFNSLDQPTEGYVMNGCILTSVRHSDKMYSSDQSNTITATFECDNIQLSIIDKLIELRKES